MKVKKLNGEKDAFSKKVRDLLQQIRFRINEERSKALTAKIG